MLALGRRHLHAVRICPMQRGRHDVLDERLGANPPTRRGGGGDAGRKSDDCNSTGHLERQAGCDELKERGWHAVPR
eukprot:15451894-Alexandrium_andersonii.AAC.1